MPDIRHSKATTAPPPIPAVARAGQGAPPGAHANSTCGHLVHVRRRSRRSIRGMDDDYTSCVRRAISAQPKLDVRGTFAPESLLHGAEVAARPPVGLQPVTLQAAIKCAAREPQRLS